MNDETRIADGAPAVRAGSGAAGGGEIPPNRLGRWVALVTVLAVLSYSATALGGEIEDDVLYEWGTAVAGAVQYLVILAIVLALARGIPRPLLGLRRPASWGRAIGLVLAGYVGIGVLAYALNFVLEAGEEQGLVPDRWEPDRAAPFVANFVVVAAVAPVVEELTYRGVGYAVTRDRWGTWAAIALTSVAFGLAHGLVVALPILTVFGVVLALVRERTRSLYPAILLHAVFNGVALLAAVTLETGS